MSVNFTPRDWVNGLDVLDSHLDTEIRDPWTGIQAAWDSSWAPGTSWTGSTTNPVLNNGTTYGRFLQIGKTILWEGRITPGTTTTFGSGTYSFTPPVAPASTSQMIGSADLGNSGVINLGSVQWVPGTGVRVRFHGASGAWSPTVPLTFSTAHTIYFWGQYEAA